MTVKRYVPFSNSRVFITLTLHIIIAFISSFMPEESLGLWLKVNIMAAVIFAVINYCLWMKFKEDSVRYFSLHSLVMLIGLAFYTMAPMFKALYATVYFWILLIVILAFTIYIFSKYKAIGKSYVKQTGFKKIVFIYTSTLLAVGSVLLWFMLATQTAQWVVVAIIFFLGGFFFLMVAPLMLITPEQVEAFELEEESQL